MISRPAISHLFASRLIRNSHPFLQKFQKSCIEPTLNNKKKKNFKKKKNQFFLNVKKDEKKKRIFEGEEFVWAFLYKGVV